MILYVNGDSYTYISDGKRYSECLSELLGCDSINASISGSCNQRILRTSLRDLILLKRKHNDIVAVISLSFLLRTELWDSDLKQNRFINDGEFVSLQPTDSKDWFLKKISSGNIYSDYLTQWLKWYNVEAQTVNLLKDILLLTSWLKQNNIKYVLFSGCLQEPIDFNSTFIKPFYEEVANDKNIIDICQFSFTEWCLNHGHVPIDDYRQEIHGKTLDIGHHGESAHRDFAKFLFENYLKS